MFAFFDVFIAGLAAVYVWVFMSQLHTPGFGRLQRWLRRGWRVPVISCSYCSSWWLSVVLVALLQLHRLDWIVTPITMIATAGLAGLIGSMTPGFDWDDAEE